MTTPRQILVIDDDADVCDVVATFLDEEGFDITVVNSTQAAMEALELWRPDLILLDLSLAGGSSKAFVAAYRSLPDQGAPIVLMSGHTNLERVALEIGADGWLTKPFDLLVLLETVEDAYSRAPRAQGGGRAIVRAPRADAPSLWECGPCPSPAW
jgi:DNA-binding response OmpR family regulator